MRRPDGARRSLSRRRRKLKCEASAGTPSSNEPSLITEIDHTVVELFFLEISAINDVTLASVGRAVRIRKQCPDDDVVATVIIDISC